MPREEHLLWSFYRWLRDRTEPSFYATQPGSTRDDGQLNTPPQMTILTIAHTGHVQRGELPGNESAGPGMEKKIGQS